MTPEIKDFTAKDGYNFLSNKSELNIKFTDKSMEKSYRFKRYI